MKPAALWPVAVVGVLAVTVGANLWLLVLSREPNAAVVEPDYYHKAVAWDSTMAERSRSDGLRWTLDATLGAAGRDGGSVTARLADSTGAPLTGARVRLEAVTNLDAAHHVVADLPETAPGLYAGHAGLTRPGLWELRFTATRGGERFLATLRRDAPGAVRP